MCTYSQLKNAKKQLCNPPPPPQGVNGAPYVTKLYASSETISQNALKVD